MTDGKFSVDVVWMSSPLLGIAYPEAKIYSDSKSIEIQRKMAVRRK